MSTRPEQRKKPRVNFERGITVQMLAIDGTWRRTCRLLDVSETGAQLQVEGSLSGLELKEFFLSLSSTGLAYRRCQKEWVQSDMLGVSFLRNDPPAKQRSRRSAARVAA